MSWRFSSFGKPAVVVEDLKKQFENAWKCEEPEESIRLAARDLILLAVEHQASDKDVRVSAYGSQTSATGDIRNSLSIAVTPEG